MQTDMVQTRARPVTKVQYKPCRKKLRLSCRPLHHYPRTKTRQLQPMPFFAPWCPACPACPAWMGSLVLSFFSQPALPLLSESSSQAAKKWTSPTARRTQPVKGRRPRKLASIGFNPIDPCATFDPFPARGPRTPLFPRFLSCAGFLSLSSPPVALPCGSIFVVPRTRHRSLETDEDRVSDTSPLTPPSTLTNDASVIAAKSTTGRAR